MDPRGYQGREGVPGGYHGRDGQKGQKGSPGLRTRPGEMGMMAGKGLHDHVGVMVDHVSITGSSNITISLVILEIGKLHREGVRVAAAPMIALLRQHGSTNHYDQKMKVAERMPADQGPQ